MKQFANFLAQQSQGMDRFGGGKTLCVAQENGGMFTQDRNEVMYCHRPVLLLLNLEEKKFCSFHL